MIEMIHQTLIFPFKPPPLFVIVITVSAGFQTPESPPTSFSSSSNRSGVVFTDRCSEPIRSFVGRMKWTSSFCARARKMATGVDEVFAAAQVVDLEK